MCKSLEMVCFKQTKQKKWAVAVNLKKVGECYLFVNSVLLLIFDPHETFSMIAFLCLHALFLCFTSNFS